MNLQFQETTTVKLSDDYFRDIWFVMVGKGWVMGRKKRWGIAIHKWYIQ